jgi:membrane-bound serine protease (ClpP class)
MEPLTFALLLVALAVIFLIAETMIPSSGLLGGLAALAAAGAVVEFFMMGMKQGVIALAIVTLASPFVFMGMLRMWPKTPVGKRMVLTAVTARPEAARRVQVGATGTTVTELRPMGECDFGDLRMEAISELGLIGPGSAVRVVALDAEGKPVVQRA